MACNQNSSSQTKQRPMVWPKYLHIKFVAAVNVLGLDNADPRDVLDLMDVDYVSVENVAIHLQRYRRSLERMANHEASSILAASLAATNLA